MKEPDAIDLAMFARVIGVASAHGASVVLVGASGEVLFQAAGFFLLGRDIAAFCSSRTCARIMEVLDVILADTHAHACRLPGRGLDEEGSARRESELDELVASVRRGVLARLSSSSPSAPGSP